jgi:hypothetical protein
MYVIKTSHASERYEPQPQPQRLPLANNVLQNKSIRTLIWGFLSTIFQRRN